MILCHGLLATDFLAPVSFPVPRDVKVRLERFFRQGGGPAANAAVAIARLGGRATFAGAVGDDEIGRAQRAELMAEGVDVAGVEIVAGAPAFVCFILVDEADGARTIYSAPQTRPLRASTADPLPGVRPALVLVDGWGGPSQGATVAAARAAGIPVMLDAGSVRDDVVALLDQSDVVIGSEPFARELTGADDPRAALRLLLERGARMAAVTRGERGVVAATADGGFEFPAHPVRAVDTTGAGDAFHGGAAWALAAGHDFETALRIGAVVAALKCRTPGARAGLPGREAVETALGASLTPPRIHP